MIFKSQIASIASGYFLILILQSYPRVKHEFALRRPDRDIGKRANIVTLTICRLVLAENSCNAEGFFLYRAAGKAECRIWLLTVQRNESCLFVWNSSDFCRNSIRCRSRTRRRRRRFSCDVRSSNARNAKPFPCSSSNFLTRHFYIAFWLCIIGVCKNNRVLAIKNTKRDRYSHCLKIPTKNLEEFCNGVRSKM